jgi:alpha-1,2-mannosyltransferase
VDVVAWLQTTAAARRSAPYALRPSIGLGLLAAVAFLARLAPVLRGGGLRGVLAYDDGVYFGATDALLSGRLPYRDFLLLHPPGVLIALAPFAFLGRLTSDPVGLAAARVAFMAIGALNAVLVYSVARRAGRVSGLVAGAMYALWGPAAYAERTTLLEPLVNLGVLAALLVLGDARVATRRQLIVAGAALGAATAVKLWAVVPLVVLAVWVFRRRGRNAGGTFVSGAAFAAGAVCLPFFWVAPGRMLRMVVMDQVGRPDNGVSTAQRLAGIVGRYHAAGHHPGTFLLIATVLAVTFLIVAALVVTTAPELRVWAALLAGQGALLVVGPVYYDHYATFVAPALCLVVGSAVGIVVARFYRLDHAWLRPVPIVAVSCLGLAILPIIGPVHREGRRLPRGRVAEVVEAARCVRADSTAALVETNLLTRDLRRRCTFAVDVTGVTYDVGSSQLRGGRPSASRRSDAAWQGFLGAYVTGADAFLVVQAHADGFGPGVRAVLRSQRVLLHDRHLTVYRTTGRR